VPAGSFKEWGDEIPTDGSCDGGRPQKIPNPFYRVL